MNILFPDIDPRAYTATAIVVGYLLIDSLDIDEQTSLAAWLTLVADTLNSNVAYTAFLEAQQANADQEKDNTQDTTDGNQDNDEDNKDEKYDALYETITKMQEEIATLKSQI